MQEIEIKIKLTDRAGLVEKIAKMGAVQVYESLEHDEYYDDAASFYTSGQVLRLREEKKGFLLTYKGVLEKHDNLLKREEIQTYVADGEKIKLILNRLGFKPKYVKEKKVEYYEVENMLLEFHTVPFLGDFLEIEAEENRLKEFLPKIGLDFSMGIPKGYNSLFAEHQKAQNLPDIAMTFEDEKQYGQK